jgi:hypothetical protein
VSKLIDRNKCLWKELAVTTYLGINISNNLSWNHHIHTMYNKTNNTTAGFLGRKRSSYYTSIKEKCYKAMVRPQVKYAAIVWDAH